MKRCIDDYWAERRIPGNGVLAILKAVRATDFPLLAAGPLQAAWEMVLVKEAGISLACSDESGVVNMRIDPLQLPPIHIPDCHDEEFEHRLLSKFYA